MSTCKLIIEDEVNIKLEGLEVDIRRKLANALKFEVPYARYMPQYKLGRWDGKVAFFGIGGSGYSFVDLVADMSGTELAKTATTLHRAEDVQNTLARIRSEVDIIPAIDDIPEGLSKQAFTEQYDTNPDVHEGINVVAKTRFENAVILYSPDVNQPVNGNAQGRQGEPCKHGPIDQRPLHLGPLPSRQNDQRSERHCPDDAVTQHLQRSNRRYPLEIDREDAPQKVGGKADQHAGARFRVTGLCIHASG